MSFSDLAGGASCGPSNPLQDLGKRFGHDRSHQLDRFASGSGSSSPAAGSSRASGFRSSPRPGAQPSHQEAFPGHAPNQHLLDMGTLRGALPSPMAAAPGRAAHAPTQHDFEASFHGPSPQQPSQQLNARASTSSPWSNDFLNNSHMQGQKQPGASRQEQTPAAAPGMYQSRLHAMPHQPNLAHQAAAMGGGMYGQAAPAFMDAHFHAQHQAPAAQLQASAPQHDDKVWTEAFTAYDAPTQAQNAEAQQVQPEQVQRPETDPFEADELARTAGRLVSTVEHDQNDKFKQSNFLNLMRKLRDREAGIQGTDIVETVPGLHTNTTLDKGKGKAVDATIQDGLSADAAPRSQQEAYQRRQEVLKRMQGSSQAGGDLRLPLERMQQEQNSNAQGREWLNELWAEEDARSEAIEAEARARQADAARQAFLGDGGDVAARMREDDSLEAREFAKYQNLGAGVLGAQSRLQSEWEEDMDEASKEDFVGRKWEGTAGRGVRGAQAAEWDKLQSDWEAFEAGPSGLRVQGGPSQQVQPQRTEPPAAFAPQNVPRYEFQANNPYLHETATATTRNHSVHTMMARDVASELDQQAAASADVQSILESEAAVQRDPTDSEAWYNLGVKQQENERETAAIAALHRAIQINPLMREAWLALAVSYTNENDRAATYESIERWIDSNEKYAGVVAAHRAAEAQAQAQQPAAAQTEAAQQHQHGHNRFHSVSSLSSDSAEGPIKSALTERHQRLVGSLLAMARHGSQLGEVDADVQVALGILFNASDEHGKAVDCFGAAISVRPDDWLLYNRIGAVLSNGGRSDEAVQYYRYALELKPDFARCHFNLAISCLNLKSYNDAARHCYTALALQHAQAEAEAQARGDSRVGSSTFNAGENPDPSQPLWETLRVSLELGNHPELAQKARMRDVTVFDPVADFPGEGEGDDGFAAGAGGDMDQSWAEANGNHPAAASVFHGLAGRD